MEHDETAGCAVIFLDIDGVLQPAESQRRFRHDLDALKRELADELGNEAYLGHDKYDLGTIRYDWDAQAVELLCRLCEDSGAQVVVSSDWRRGKSVTTLKEYFHVQGLGDLVRDKTTDEREAYGERAEEIREYLDSHPGIERFVIIDDQYKHEFGKFFPGRHVHTGYRYKAEDDRRAREILAGQRTDCGTEAQPSR